MIAELWGAPDGQIYYRLDNWDGFYVAIPDYEQHPQSHVHEIPEPAICLIRDGQWTGNFIGKGGP